MSEDVKKLMQEVNQLLKDQKWEQLRDKSTEILRLSSSAEIEVSTYNNRGVAKYKLGDHNGAIADYDKALEIDPKYTNVYNNRGVAKCKLGDYNGAIEDFDKVLEIDPKYADAYNNRGLAKNDLGDSESAIADFDKALEINPEYADAYYNRGIAKSILHNYEGAIADYDEAIRIDPDDKRTIHNRAAALALQLAEKQRKEIEKKYQDRLQVQQKEFEERIKRYEGNIYKDGDYAERVKQYQCKIKSIECHIKQQLKQLQHGAFVVFGVVIIVAYLIRNFENLGFAGILPIVFLGVLVLSPQFWRIRMLNRDKHKYWALREDAYTKGVLANLIDVEPEVRKELIGKFFDHHDKRGSAQLIADWARRENGGDGESAVNSVKNYLKPNKDNE